jgi:allantoicase
VIEIFFILRCIIQLATTGTVSLFDIDTANFNGVLTHYHRYLLKSICVHSPSGNEAPEASVYALYDAELKDPRNDDPRVLMPDISSWKLSDAR